MVELRLNDYLSAEHIKKFGNVCMIADEGRYLLKEESGFKRDVFQIKVKMGDGECFIWSMNKESEQNLMRSWGRETKNWIEKFVQFEIIKLKINGQIKESLIGTAKA